MIKHEHKCIGVRQWRSGGKGRKGRFKWISKWVMVPMQPEAARSQE